jgi:hypothetical protein
MIEKCRVSSRKNNSRENDSCATLHTAHTRAVSGRRQGSTNNMSLLVVIVYTSAEDVDGLVSIQCRRMYLAARPGRRRRFTGPGGHCRASPDKRCTLSSHQAGVMRARDGWEHCGSGRTTHFSVTLAAETRSTHEPLWVEGKSFATCTGCFGFTQCHSHTIGRHRGRHPTYFCPACRRFCFAVPGFAQAVIGRSPRRTERTVRNHELPTSEYTTFMHPMVPSGSTSPDHCVRMSVMSPGNVAGRVPMSADVGE